MKRMILALGGIMAFVQAGFAQEIGFFSPRGTDARFARKVNFAMVNVNSVEQVSRSVSEARAAGLKITLDFGPVIAIPRDPKSLVTDYVDDLGNTLKKTFFPKENNKIRDIIKANDLVRIIGPYIDIIADNQGVVDTLFMVDEPYLNGVSKKQLEEVALLFKSELNKRDISGVKIGVLFASSMFNSEFAKAIEHESLRYVNVADTYRAKTSETEEGRRWADNFDAFRLTTYDSAGNRYVGGGIPQGFDIVAFDFYISTLLMDSIYEESLDWFARNTNTPECDRFYMEKVSAIRKKLSFFQDGPVVAGEDVRNKDRSILDDLFDCRMNATLELLNREISALAEKPEVMLIGESSNNGMLEFSADGTPETGQPSLLVEARVNDEVARYLDLFRARRADNVNRIAFFTFDDEFDETIQLAIGGASTMPSVLNTIFSAAATE